MTRIAVLIALLAVGASAQDKPAAPPVDAEGLEFFEKKIRPVLVEKCYSCHSAEAKKIKAALRLDTREGTLKGGETARGAVQVARCS